MFDRQQGHVDLVFFCCSPCSSSWRQYSSACLWSTTSCTMVQLRCKRKKKYLDIMALSLVHTLTTFEIIFANWAPAPWLDLETLLAARLSWSSETRVAFFVVFELNLRSCRVLVDNIGEWFTVFFLVYRCLSSSLPLESTLGCHAAVLRRYIQVAFLASPC